MNCFRQHVAARLMLLQLPVCSWRCRDQRPLQVKNAIRHEVEAALLLSLMHVCFVQRGFVFVSHCKDGV